MYHDQNALKKQRMPKQCRQSNPKMTTARTALTFMIALACLFGPVPARAADRMTPVVRAVKKIAPAVVNISSEYEIRERVHPFSGLGMDPFFESFFRDFFDPGFERQYKRASLGSGVIIDGRNGFILTNAHVVDKMGDITAVLQDEREFKARIVGTDLDFDLAVLRIDADAPLPAVEMGRSDDLMIGETVIAIGNPFGFSHTVTTGVVSALNRSVRTEDRVFHDFIQIDASINPGNSGGPLLNINGDLIGVNTAIYAKAQGIGFAIPIDKARRIVSDLIKYGEVAQSWLGMSVQDMDRGMARYLKTPDFKGVIIREIERGGPAAAAGIREGDIVLSLKGIDLYSADDYNAVVKTVSPGETVKTVLWRNGKTASAALEAGVFTMERAADLAWEKLGVRVADQSPAARRRYGVMSEKGVIVSEVSPRSYLASIGVRAGDVIRQIDDMAVDSADDFEKAMAKFRRKSTLVILIQRGDRGYYVSVKL